MLTFRTINNIVIFSLIGLISLFSCSSPTTKVNSYNNQPPDKTEKIDDSTVCYSFNLSDTEKDMIYVCKGDTITKVRYNETEVYENHIFYDKAKNIIKINQYLKPIGIKERINEIIYFKDNRTIDSSDSRVLFCEIKGDSLRFHADNHSLFNKTRILIGDTNVFEKWDWKNPIKFETNSSYITIPNSFKGKKCVFQRITTDKEGEDKSGYDIYFETENIICRDIEKSLVCFPKK